MSKSGKVVATIAARSAHLRRSTIDIPHESEPTLIRGKYVILAIFALALLATGFAVWYRYQQSRRTVPLWGSPHAGRIRNAPEVEVWRIASTGSDTSETVDAPDNTPARVTGRRVLPTIPDLTYIRRAFLTDAFFLWDKPAGDCTPHWTFVIQFRAGDETTTLWIDDACDRVVLAETGASATMNAALLKSVRTFLDRNGPKVEPAVKPVS